MFRPKSTLEQWRIFQAVVEFGGYAQAAEKLNKSQSSLRRCSLYVLLTIFTPPDSQDFALLGSWL